MFGLGWLRCVRFEAGVARRGKRGVQGHLCSASVPVVPRPLRTSRASGSVFEACVSFRRFVPRKLDQRFESPSSSSSSSFGRKLFIDAYDSSSVPSAEKCSLLSKFFFRACSPTAAKKRVATSDSIMRLRFLPNVVRVERLVCELHVQEPLEQHVVAELLTEQSLASQTVQRHQERRLQQVLGRDRGSTDAGVHLVEDRLQFSQSLIRKLLHRSRRFVLDAWYGPLR